METHLSYPILAYCRVPARGPSYAALCAVLDSCALAVAAARPEPWTRPGSRFHPSPTAVADLSYTLHTTPTPPAVDRLPPASLEVLLSELREIGVEIKQETVTIAERLGHLRGLYEPYVENALANRLDLRLPEWMATESPDNWRTTEWH